MLLGEFEKSLLLEAERSRASEQAVRQLVDDFDTLSTIYGVDNVDNECMKRLQLIADTYEVSFSEVESFFKLKKLFLSLSLDLVKLKALLLPTLVASSPQRPVEVEADLLTSDITVPVEVNSTVIKNATVSSVVLEMVDVVDTHPVSYVRHKIDFSHCPSDNIVCGFSLSHRVFVVGQISPVASLFYATMLSVG